MHREGIAVYGEMDKLKNPIPKDFTYSEARTLLTQLGFVESTKGKTSGSRVKFYRAMDQRILLLYKPHPGDIMKVAAVRQLANFVMNLGVESV